VANDDVKTDTHTGRRAWWVVGAVVAIVALDQLTKSWAVSALADGPINVIGDHARFELTHNSGSAFSGFQNYTPVLAVIATVITILIARAVRRATDPWVITGLVLVLGGALGNLVDRFARSPGFLRGHVVDFLQLPRWPVFNVADMCINVAAAVIIVQAFRGISLRGERREHGSGPS